MPVAPMLRLALTAALAAQPALGYASSDFLRRGAARLKPGEGSGRPMYSFQSVHIPEESDSENCISLKMDKSTHSLVVDTSPADTSTIASACYADKISSTGWASLKVQTSPSTDIPNHVKIYSAGFIEGLLTQKRIAEFHSNVVQLLAKDTSKPGTAAAVEKALRLSLVAWEHFGGDDLDTPPEDPVQKEAWAALVQLRGIRDGHNLAAYRAKRPELSAYDLLLCNAHAEIPAIAQVFGTTAAASLETSLLNAEEATGWERWLMHRSRGSGYVKRVGSQGDARDLLVGHVTWGDYSEMTRIFKHYYMNHGSPVSAIAMSSYPGCISSTDDYFIASNGMAAISTALGVPPQGKDAQPHTDGLPSFLRSLVAMRLSTSPQQWAKIYGFITGIAGGKQWLVVDFGQLEPRTALKDGTLFMVEALPKTVRAGDMTTDLREDGFFQAHGAPHFADIREAYGLGNGTAPVKQAKASSLVQNGATVSNLGDAKNFLTNSFAELGQGQIPVSGRYDIGNPGGFGPAYPAGGIDAKLTNACLVSKLGSLAHSGPPKNITGATFSWEADGLPLWADWPHLGLPTTWDFAWVDAMPQGLTSPSSPDNAECVQR